MSNTMTPIWRRWYVLVPAALLVAGAGVLVSMRLLFPGTRCEAFKHPNAPEGQNDCYTCHVKTTPKIAQDWFESKHGVVLVKCFVCHGSPDGKGSLPFAAKPDAQLICQRCHAPAMERMKAKFGESTPCASCHPYHQNSMHHEAYARTESKKVLEQE